MDRQDVPANVTRAGSPDDRAAKNRNLLVRVATALVLLPAVLALMWYGGLPFAVLAALAAAANAYELSTMALGRDRLRVVAIAGAASMPFFFLPSLHAERQLHWLWAAVLVTVLTWRLFRNQALQNAANQVAMTLFAAIYGSLVGYVVPLRGLGGQPHSWTAAGWVLLACAITWGGDTGAYAAGRLFGRRKLLPRVSPAKTWEGFFGGMAASVGFAFAVQAFAGLGLRALDCVAIGVLGGIAGPLGDLGESMLKRAWNAKDSGWLLPGHGGMLDRVDALLVNAPLVFFYAKLVVLPRIH